MKNKPELGARVVCGGRMYEVAMLGLGPLIGVRGIGQSNGSIQKPLSELEDPDDCWCDQCNAYAPNEERMRHPTSGWIHTKCAADEERSDMRARRAEADAKAAEKWERQRVGRCHPDYRGPLWRAGREVLMPMRVVGTEDSGRRVLIEPASCHRPDEMGLTTSAVVFASSLLPTHVQGLTDEALKSRAAEAVAELIERGLTCEVDELRGGACACGCYHPGSKGAL